MTTTIRDLVQEALGHRTEGNFQITAIASQIDRIREDMRKEWDKSGLVIVADANTLPVSPFSVVSYGGTVIKFVEGDHFSIEETTSI